MKNNSKPATLRDIFKSLTAFSLIIAGILGGLLIAADEAEAVGPISISSIAGSGKFSTIDKNGETIVISYLGGSSNIIVWAISNDNGTTWREVSTGVVGEANYQYYRTIVLDDDSWATTYRVSSGTNQARLVYTNNGGTTVLQKTATTPSGYPNFHTGQSSISAIDNTYVWTYTVKTGPSGTPGIAMTKSTDSGSTWSTPVNIATNGSGCFGKVAVSLEPNDWTIFSSFYSTTGCLTSGATRDVRAYQSSDNGATWGNPLGYSSNVINDPFNPLTDYGDDITSDPRSARAIAFRDADDATYQEAYVGFRLDSGDYIISQIEVTDSRCTINNINAYGSSGAGNLICFDAGTYVSTDYFRFVYTNDAGLTYSIGTMTDLTGVDNANSAEAVPQSIFVCPYIYFAYKSPVNSRAAYRSELVPDTDCEGLSNAGNRLVFCSAASQPDFGYNYVEDVELDFTQGANQDIAPAYEFSGTDENLGYLGKNFNPGSRILTNYFSLQADQDSANSVFRSAFSFVNSVPSSVTKGNGFETESFAEHVEVGLTEVGNDWAIGIYIVSDANGVEEITLWSPVVEALNPNDINYFAFKVNTTSGKAFVRYLDPDTLDTIEVFPNGVTLPSYFTNDYMYTQWYVGYGSNSFATSWLDTGDSYQLSTCIYNEDITDPVPNGNPGREPNEELPDPTSSSTSSNPNLATNNNGFVIPTDSPDTFFGIKIDVISEQWGISESGFRWLLGLFVIGLVVGGLTSNRTGGLAVLLGGIGALIGIGIGVAFGLLPVWFLLLIVFLVIVMAARLFFGGNSDEE